MKEGYIQAKDYVSDKTEQTKDLAQSAKRDSKQDLREARDYAS